MEPPALLREASARTANAALLDTVYCRARLRNTTSRLPPSQFATCWCANRRAFTHPTLMDLTPRALRPHRGDALPPPLPQEQARYGHLCTIMSRLHHRRAGYPFGAAPAAALFPGAWAPRAQNAQSGTAAAQPAPHRGNAQPPASAQHSCGRSHPSTLAPAARSPIPLACSA